MALLDNHTKEEVKKFFGDLGGDVKLTLSVRKDGCEYCGEVKQLLQELSELIPSVDLSIEEVDASSPAPVIQIEGKNKGKMAYYGIPAGHEFGAFLTGLKDSATGAPSALDDETAKEAEKIGEKVEIKVFVTPTCVYCPQAAITAFDFALNNPNIEVKVLEAMEFADLANKYGVRAVPKIVINDKVQIEGAVPPDVFLKKIVSALE